MPGVYDVVDVTKPDLQPLYNRLVALRETTVLRYESMSNAVVQMGNDILHKAGRRGADVVRIWGHGLPGVMAIAAGDMPEWALYHYAGLAVRVNYDPKNFDNKTFESNLVPASLKPLAEALSQKARLELHGCSIASSDVGELFCKDLAKKLMCWVWASTTYQTDLEWEPPVLAFLPNGTLIRDLEPPPLTSTSQMEVPGL